MVECSRTAAGRRRSLGFSIELRHGPKRVQEQLRQDCEDNDCGPKASLILSVRFIGALLRAALWQGYTALADSWDANGQPQKIRL